MNAPLKCDRLVRQRAHWRCTNPVNRPGGGATNAYGASAGAVSTSGPGTAAGSAGLITLVIDPHLVAT